MRLLAGAMVLCCVVQPLAAQQRKPEAKPRQRVAGKPVIRLWEAGALAGLTAGAMVVDRSVRHAIVRDTSVLPSVLVRAGDAFGNIVYVYPALAAGTLAGLALGNDGLKGASWRALQSTALAGGAALVLKSAIGRRRPDVSPNSAFVFRPLSFKNNSFPSGHTTIAFALATSLATETKGKWSDLLFFSAASLTGFSRINDDRHWLSDVVFGAAVGIVSARVVHRWHRGFVVTPQGVGLSLTF
ncbi:MAG TPA: phosphatase PAP2 family protein [Gemmatimonadales bacterium]|jgi:membrane-associated phospholipid phosphatase